MAIPVLTAVSDAVWGSSWSQHWSEGDHGVTVVRRCVDLADLLATAGDRTGPRSAPCPPTCVASTVMP